MAVEYPTLVSVIQTDTFEEWRVKTNSMIAHTEAAAQNVGNLNFLNTDGQSTIVDAINEVDTHADTNTANIGPMTEIDGKIIRSTIVDTLNAAVAYHEKYTTDAVAAEALIRLTKDNALQSELDLTQTTLGFAANGTVSFPTGATYINTSSTVMQALNALDAGLKDESDMVDTLRATIGTNVNGTFNYNGNNVNYMSATNGNAAVKTNLIELDSQVKVNSDNINASQSELDLTQATLGFAANGTVSFPTGATYINTSSTVMQALNALDTGLTTGVDTLRATIGTNANGIFNYNGNNVNYISATNGNAVVKTNLIELDSQVKVNSDNIVVNVNSIDAINTKVENILDSVGLNSQGILAADLANDYAVGTEVRYNIKLLDDKIKSLDSKLETDTDTQIATLVTDIATKEDKVTIGNLSALDGNIGDISNIVAAINSLYSLLAPLLAGADSTPFVRRNGDTMTGTLSINGGDLEVNGSQNNAIRSSGDVCAYVQF